MTEIIIKNILRFFGLVLLQVLILNNIQLSGYINPYLYVLFILLLPFTTPNWLIIILSFVLGFTIDSFSDTMGLHSAACVLMGFCRPSIIKMGFTKNEYDMSNKPIIKDLGLSWFFSYSLMLVSIHHILLFYLEVFNFREFWSTLLRTFSSIIFTMLLIIMSQYIFYKKK